MKKILLIFHLQLALGVASYAQNVQGQSTMQKQGFFVSKDQYLSKTNQLGALMKAHNTEQEQAKWGEVNAMMISEFSIVKQKIFESVNANNLVDKQKYEQLYKQQYAAYSKIIEQKRNAPSDDVKLMEIFNEFSQLIVLQ